MLNDYPDTAKRIPPYVREILKLIESSGHKAYVAGGAVRDIVLGKTPHDYDIATSAKPDETVSMFAQAGLNYYDNAAKHGGEGKRITASMRLEGNFVVTQIRDFGPGIPVEELPHVKMKFYKGSSKARGSGIGLAVCDQIVQLHGGTLTLENAEGGGTLVTVSLPVTQ